jgi:hypothetical protein
MAVYIWTCPSPKKYYNTVYSKIECEKLHIKFCKRVLGVHQKSTNFAVLSELGRFPIHYQMI